MKMKRGYWVVLFVIYIQCSGIFAVAQSIEITNAIQTLETTKPLLDPSGAMMSIDPEAKRSNILLYQRQMEAVAVLSKRKPPNAAAYLIPYLNYSTPDVFFFDSPPLTENLSTTRSKWPVFSALLDMPGAAQALKDYSLDVRSPLKYRLAAFVVLRYVDSSRFKEVAKVFDTKLQNAPNDEKVFLSDIENGKYAFWGIHTADQFK